MSTSTTLSARGRNIPPATHEQSPRPSCAAPRGSVEPVRPIARIGGVDETIEVERMPTPLQALQLVGQQLFRKLVYPASSMKRCRPFRAGSAYYVFRSG